MQSFFGARLDPSRFICRDRLRWAGLEGDAPVEVSNLDLILVSDTDVLNDRLWVQVENFFGQQVATAFADNGSLLTNLVDYFTGVKI